MKVSKRKKKICPCWLSVQGCETDWNSSCHREWEKNVRTSLLTSCIERSCSSKECINFGSVLSPYCVFRQFHCDYPWLHSHQLCSLGNITILTRCFMLGLRRDNVHLAMPFSTAYGAMQYSEEENK